jgi:hypothetical protein
MLLYAGKFEVGANGLVLHDVTNASRFDLIGRRFVRQIDQLTKDTLVLSGTFDGKKVRLVWKK